MRLHLHQNMRRLLRVAIHRAARLWIKAFDSCACDHRRIIRIRHQGTRRIFLVRITNHAEQRQRLRRAVDYPIGVENFMPAMFGVGLGEHHQLDIGRIAFQADEIFQQIIDFIRRQRQPQIAIGGHQSLAPADENIHTRNRFRRMVIEQLAHALHIGEHRLGHAVMDQRQQRAVLVTGQRRPTGFA